MSNLLQRLSIAIIAIPALLWIAQDGRAPLYVLIIVLQVGMLYEWQRLWKSTENILSLPGLLLALVGADFILLSKGVPMWSSVGIALLSIWLLLAIRPGISNRSREVGLTLLFVLWAAVPLGLWIHMSPAGDDRFTILGPLAILLISTWCCDSGAYFVGRSIGGPKLYPQASPNKTVSGAIGGLIFSALPLSVVALADWGSPNLPDIVMLAIAVGIFGQAGDLFESLLKREAGVKDSSQIIPGHGGLLDRFDSLLLSTPAFFAYLLISSIISG